MFYFNLSKKFNYILASIIITYSFTVISSNLSAESSTESTNILSANFAVGFKNGTYEQIAKTLNTAHENLNFKIKNSKGSPQILRMLKKNKCQIGITQLDILLENYQEQSSFLSSKLKILLPLYTEDLHLIALKNIQSVSDLKGKRIVLGSKLSGSYKTGELVLKTFNITNKNTTFLHYNVKTAFKKLITNKIDAIVIVSGHPVKLLQNLPPKLQSAIHLINIDNESLKKITQAYFHYRLSEIPGNIYKWQNSRIKTIGVVSAIVTNNFFSLKDANTLLKIIFENKNSLSKVHPKFSEINTDIIQFYLASRRNYFHPSAIAFFE